MKKLGIALLVTVLLGAAGCGGGGRPSVEDVANAFRDGVKSSSDSGDTLKLKRSDATCAAKLFVASKLSDATLERIVDDHTYKQNVTNDKVISGLTDKLAKCGPTS